MIAALPMYDRPETEAGHDALWSAIRAALTDDGVDAPERLTRGRSPIEVWRDPALLFAQTCGLPFRAMLHGRVHLVCTADYAVAGASAGHYRSVFVARRDDPRNRLSDFACATFAFNEESSQSGWAAPLTEAARVGVRFARGVETGAHRASAEAVAAGAADLAAIDEVLWRGIERWDACAAGLRIVARTAPTPGLPFVTARPDLVEPLARATERAIAELPAVHQRTLGIAGAIRIPAAEYLRIPTPRVL